MRWLAAIAANWENSIFGPKSQTEVRRDRKRTSGYSEWPRPNPSPRASASGEGSQGTSRTHRPAATIVDRV